MRKCFYTRLLRINVCVLLGLAARAADAPAVNHEHWEVYFQARADVMETKAAYDAAQARLNAAVEALSVDCGEGFTPGLDTTTRRGSCIPKAK